MISGGWSFECKVCDEAMVSENNGDYEQLLNENDQFNYFKGNVFPCDSGFGPSVATCDDEQDACVKYSLDFLAFPTTTARSLQMTTTTPCR